MINKQISLPKAPKVVYLIGLIGSGKTYIGKFLSEFADFYHYEADETLPDDMREAIEKNEKWTDTQLDNYYLTIREKIIQLSKIYPKIVVTQATYFQRHRDLMKEVISDLEFIWVRADYEIILKRIRERNDYVTVEYFELSNGYFETPDDKTKVIENNHDKLEIVRQLLDYFG